MFYIKKGFILLNNFQMYIYSFYKSDITHQYKKYCPNLNSIVNKCKRNKFHLYYFMIYIEKGEK